MKLRRLLKKKSGRSLGKVTVRHQGGREKRFYREIDFKRNKYDIWGKVVALEYDPNRNCSIALISYEDGEKTYIIAPLGLDLGQKIIASDAAPISAGCCLPLSKIPVGTSVHCIEIYPGKGAQMVKGAGSSAVVQGKEENFVLIKLPSGEIRRFKQNSRATVGQVSNPDYKNIVIGKAGRKRHMGIKPSVRGVAQNPKSHPHGGGEGRSGVGMKFPKTPYGKKAVGKTRKVKKYSDKYIVTPRRKGPHVG